MNNNNYSISLSCPLLALMIVLCGTVAGTRCGGGANAGCCCLKEPGTYNSSWQKTALFPFFLPEFLSIKLRATVRLYSVMIEHAFMNFGDFFTSFS